MIITPNAPTHSGSASPTAAGVSERGDTGTVRAHANFHGATIAQFESRLSGAMESLIRRHGGNPWLAPALSEVPIANNPELPEVFELLASGNIDFTVFLTGVGARHLCDAAEHAGIFPNLYRAVVATTIVCRGPKPVLVLKQHGIRPRHLVPAPHTTAQLLDYLGRLPIDGRSVLIVSAGEKMDEPGNFLRARGALPVEIQLYRWDLTESDAQRLADTVRALIAGTIDAVAFTTQVQVRHLFDVAIRIGELQRLIAVLRANALVGAVGPTCAASLRQRGVEPDVTPEHPRMGHLVVELAHEYVRRLRDSSPTGRQQ